MARHRWATGEQTSAPDRLERVLNLSAGVPGATDTETARVGFVNESGIPAAGGFGTPRSRSGRRWAATRRAALVAAGCALTVGGWQFVSADRDTTEIVPVGRSIPGTTKDAGGTESPDPSAAPAQEGTSPPAGSSGSDAAQTEKVLVHVAGAVQSPGVVEVPAGSRVFEALEKAGGALPEAELSAVNLAAVVNDGQQLLIPRAGEPSVPAGPVPAPDAGAAEGPVNLNSADAAELEQLPRVGPVLAERIVQWREEHGSFTSAGDLDAVPGIGPAMLESLLPLVTV